MRSYTPINEFRIKDKEAKEFLKTAKKMLAFSVDKIHVTNQIFDELLEGVSPSDRSVCSDGIPFYGKLLVRKNKS